jgi:branched-chain amino acid transport system substrate-binding protein
MPSPRLLLAGLLLPLALAGCGPKTAAEPVWVGHLVPLTGTERAQGERAVQGVRLAVDEARAADMTVAGHRIAVRHADSHGRVDTAQAEAVRLLAVNRVAALLGGPDPAVGEQLVLTAQPYEAPVVLPCELADPPAGKGVVSLGAAPSWRGKVLARYAAEDLKAAHAVVLTDSRNLVAMRLASGFTQSWREGSKRTVDEWSYAKDAELADLKDRVAGAKPDVVLVAAPAHDFPKLRAQLHAAGVKTALLYGGEDVGAENFREPREGADVYLATVYAAEGLAARGKDFARRYEERFHVAPDLAAAQAYDAARLLFAAMHRAQDVSSARIREELARGEPFESVTGPVLWKDGEPRQRLFVVRLATPHAAPQVVQTVEPEGK